MKFTYRPSRLSDLDGIMQIYIDAQAAMERSGNPQWPKGFPDRKDIKGGILGGILYTVECGGEVAAVFSAMNYDNDYDGIDGAWLTRGNYLAVHRVAVAEKFLRRGAATYIVDCASHEIAVKRGRHSIRMDTHEKNLPMRALLEKCGFTACGTIELARDYSRRIAFEKKL